MPAPKTIPFAPKLHLWPETLASVEARVRRHLLRLRRQRHRVVIRTIEDLAILADSVEVRH